MAIEDAKQASAIALLALVLSLPLLSADALAFAATTKDPLAWGADEIPGFARTRDTPHISINVSIPGDSAITADQVKKDGAAFNSCVQQGTDPWFYCRWDSSRQVGYNPGSTSLAITIYDDNGEAAQNNPSATLYIDNKGASVTSLDISPNPVGNRNVTIAYSAQDALTDTQSSPCVGVKQLVLSAGPTTVRSIDINESRRCSVYGSIDLPSSSLGSGTVMVCMRAFDYFGKNASSLCKEVRIRLVGATINRFDMLLGETPASYVQGTETVRFRLNITDTMGVSAGNVLANLSAFNSIASPVPATTCETQADGSTILCTWEGIALRMTATVNAQVRINVTDDVGNSIEQTVSKTINVDKIAPLVSGVRIEADGVPLVDANNTYYLRNGNVTAKVDYIETGSGMFSKRSSIILDGRTITADSCTQTQCVFNVTGLQKPDGSVVPLIVQGTDDAGNGVLGTRSFMLKLDANAPRFNDVQLRVNGLFTVGNFTAPTKNDQMTFVFNMSDTISPMLSAVGDFTAIGDDLRQGTCVKQNRTNNLLCTFNARVNVEGYSDATLMFNFTDIVGNTYSYPYTFRTYEQLEERNDLWLGEVGDPSPSAIDRAMMPIYPAFIAFPITLTKNSTAEGIDASTRIWPIKITVGDCTTLLIGQDTEGKNLTIDTSRYIKRHKPELIDFNDPAAWGSSDSYHFYLRYTMEATAMPADLLPITCMLTITSNVGNTSIVSNEQMLVPVWIPFYENTLGEASASVTKEINDTLNNGIVSQEWLDDAEQVLGYANTLCGLIGTLEKLQMIFGLIKDAAAACEKFPALAGTCQVIGKAAGRAHTPTEKAVGETHNCKGKGGILSMSCAKAFCGFISCSSSYSTGTNEQQAVEETSKPVVDALDAKAKTSTIYADWQADYAKTISDPKQSIVTSILSMPPCLPGIIYNLQKYRTVKCQYAYCLEQVASGISTVDVCKQMYSYAQCQFVGGQIMYAIPMAGYISNFLKGGQAALQDWYSLGERAISTYCRTQCGESVTGAVPGVCTACNLLELANMVADFACDLGIGSGDSCKPSWERNAPPKPDEQICNRAFQTAKDMGIRS